MDETEDLVKKIEEIDGLAEQLEKAIESGEPIIFQNREPKKVTVAIEYGCQFSREDIEKVINQINHHLDDEIIIQDYNSIRHKEYENMTTIEAQGETLKTKFYRWILKWLE